MTLSGSFSGIAGAGTPLRFQNFTNQDLSGKKYYKADMRGSDFSGANMQVLALFQLRVLSTPWPGSQLS